MLTMRAPSSPKADKIRVLIVDDHPAIREALADTLSTKMDMEFAGEAASAGEALSLIEKVRPDVAVVDISLKDAHGLDLVQNVRIQFPDVQVVVFSMYDESAYAERAIRAGALRSEERRVGKGARSRRHTRRSREK